MARGWRVTLLTGAAGLAELGAAAANVGQLRNLAKSVTVE